MHPETWRLSDLKRAGSFFIYTIIALSISVLAGWYFDIEILKRPAPDLAAMNPTSALLFILAGASLILSGKNKTGIYILSSTILATACIRILDVVFGLHARIDQFILSEKLQQYEAFGGSNRMAFNTAICFLLLSAAIILIKQDSSKKTFIAQINSLLIALLALLSIIGYLFQVQMFHGILHYFSMAPYTATAFLLAAFAILFFTSEKGIMREIMSHYSGSTTARMLIPTAIIIPVFLGYIILLAHHSDVFTFELGITLLVLSFIIVFVLLIWFNTVAENKKDALRKKAETELDTLNKQLENRIRKGIGELRKFETNYQELFDKANDAIYIHELQTGKVLEVNDKAAEITGFSKQELLKNGARELITDNPEYSFEKALDHIRNAAAGTPQLFEWLGKNKDGSYNWFEVNLKRANIGGEDRIIAFFREINKRKDSELKIKKLNEKLELKVIERNAQLEENIQQLKESEEKFQKAFMASAAGITITRISDATFLEVNDAFTEITGFSREELIGATALSLGMVENIEKRAEVIKKVNETGSASYFENTLRHKSGKIITVLASGETIMIKREKFALYIIYDITERKKIEDDLRESEAKFRMLMNLAPVGITVADANGSVIDTNQSMLDMLGLSSKQEFFDKVLSEPGITQEQRDALTEILKKGPVKNFESMANKKDGSPIWTSTNITLYNSPGETQYISATVDITEQKHDKEELMKVNKDLETFSYSVSHDLRAPLRNISGYVQMLMEDYGTHVDENGIRIMNIINKNALRMGTLIDNLLEFAQLGHSKVSKKEVNMNVIVKEIVDEIKQSTNADAEIKIASLPEVYADAALLRQAIYNLISNGVKYSSANPDPVVEISSEVNDKEIIFSVHDNGVGFDMKYADKLFTVFQRLHSSKQFEGTGIGLALVHRIITEHGGRVWAEGKVNEGATFSFSLPRN